VLAREDAHRDLFADPQQSYAQAVQFYRHEVDWSNRMILGDSLAVMASLARREDLAGKVQMIYIDPPYGISFKSNFQPQLGQRDVKDKVQDLTREPEMVKAYRDTWTRGVHSYLAYIGGAGGSKYTSAQLPSGEQISWSSLDATEAQTAKVFRSSPLVSQSGGAFSRFPGVIDEARFDELTGYRTLAFARPTALAAGRPWCVALKVIDPRGNEGLRVITMPCVN